MSKKRLVFNYIYILITILVIGFLLAGSIDKGDIRTLFSDMNYIWFVAAVGCIILHWLTDALIVYQIIPYIAREKRGFFQCVKFGIIGLYYAALTPFASGGQPMQVVYMKREGIPVGKSTAIVSVKHFLYLLAMCTSFVTYMIIRGGAFYSEYKAIFWIAVAGFLANLIGVVFIFIMLTNRNLAVRICKWIIKGLYKVKLVRSEERAYFRIEKTIMDFSKASSYMNAHKVKTAVTFILSLFKLSFFFAVPYMIFRAFNLTGFDFIDLSSLNTFMFLTVSFMPTPGTSFAAEGGFRLIFYPVYGELIPMAIGLWRIITYYLILIVGAVLVIIDQMFSIKRGRRMITVDDAKVRITSAEGDEDIEIIVGLAKEIWTQHYQPIIGIEQVNYMLDKFQSADAVKENINDGYTYFIVYCNREPGGYCAVKRDNGVFLSKFYVRKDLRGLGLGKAMTEKIAEYAAEYDEERIWLTCNKYNSATLEIYKKLGYEIIDDIVTDIGNGYVMDDYVLEKKLQEAVE